MTFAFSDLTVTTWRLDDDGNVWRARAGADHFAEFSASRDAPIDLLYELGRQALWPEGDGA